MAFCRAQFSEKWKSLVYMRVTILGNEGTIEECDMKIKKPEYWCQSKGYMALCKVQDNEKWKSMVNVRVTILCIEGTSRK